MDLFVEKTNSMQSAAFWAGAVQTSATVLGTLEGRVLPAVLEVHEENLNREFALLADVLGYDITPKVPQ